MSPDDRDKPPRAAPKSGFKLPGSPFGLESIFGKVDPVDILADTHAGRLAATEAARHAIEEIELDDSIPRTAENTERMAEMLGLQQRAVNELVGLTKANLELSTRQREDAAKVERFTRRMTWASLGVSGGSLAVALAALALTIWRG